MQPQAEPADQSRGRFQNGKTQERASGSQERPQKEQVGRGPACNSFVHGPYLGFLSPLEHCQISAVEGSIRVWSGLSLGSADVAQADGTEPSNPTEAEIYFPVRGSFLLFGVGAGQVGRE